jgi:hypothetical protein
MSRETKQRQQLLDKRMPDHSIAIRERTVLVSGKGATQANDIVFENMRSHG